jgi:hypothetical protein
VGRQDPAGRLEGWRGWVEKTTVDIDRWRYGSVPAALTKRAPRNRARQQADVGKRTKVTSDSPTLAVLCCAGRRPERQGRKTTSHIGKIPEVDGGGGGFMEFRGRKAGATGAKNHFAHRESPGARRGFSWDFAGRRPIQTGSKNPAGSVGETRAQPEKSRLKDGCSQDWLPHKGLVFHGISRAEAHSNRPGGLSHMDSYWPQVGLELLP